MGLLIGIFFTFRSGLRPWFLELQFLSRKRGDMKRTHSGQRGDRRAKKGEYGRELGQNCQRITSFSAGRESGLVEHCVR